MHYMLESPFFIEAREQHKAAFSFLEYIKIETLLFEVNTLSEELNNEILQSVKL